jgi:hypothetical protein
VRGERAQTGAETADEDDRLHRLLELLLLDAAVVAVVLELPWLLEDELLPVALLLLPPTVTGVPLLGLALLGAVVDGATSVTLAIRSATSGFALIVEPSGMKAITNDSLAPRRILSKPEVKI